MTVANQQIGSIHVLGSGIRSVGQVTLEANYLLQQMDKVFHDERDPSLSAYLQAIGATEVSLSHLCVDFDRREDAYQRICDEILASSEIGDKCAYLTPGNPVFLNTVVLKLKQAALRLNIPFFLYPGLSSIDTLLTDLCLPVEQTGLQCFEATQFVRMRPAIDKRVPLCLFQPAVVNAFDVRYKAGAYIEGVKLLHEVLLSIYSDTAVWLLIRSAMSNKDNAVVCSGKLNELVDRAATLELGTLVIPGDWARGIGLLESLGVSEETEPFNN